MPTSRRKIPEKIAADVVFLADFLCCVCRQRGQHIHHLDRDPTNFDTENLVLLCVTCHDDATSTRRLTRKLSAELLRKYREDLHAWVRHRRAMAVQSTVVRALDDDARAFGLMLEAVSVREIQKIGFDLHGFDWEEYQPALTQLSFFPEDMGIRTRIAVLQVLDSLAHRTRFQMPTDIGTSVASLAYQTLPLWSLYKPTELPIDDHALEAFRLGILIGEGLCYDGGLYLEDYLIVDGGAALLWRILAYARLNKLMSIEERVLEGFRLAEDGTKRSGDAEMHALVLLYKQNGMTCSPRFPDYPRHIAERLIGARRKSRAR